MDDYCNIKIWFIITIFVVIVQFGISYEETAIYPLPRNGSVNSKLPTNLKEAVLMAIRYLTIDILKKYVLENHTVVNKFGKKLEKLTERLLDQEISGIENELEEPGYGTYQKNQIQTNTVPDKTQDEDKLTKNRVKFVNSLFKGYSAVDLKKLAANACELLSGISDQSVLESYNVPYTSEDGNEHSIKIIHTKKLENSKQNTNKNTTSTYQNKLDIVPNENTNDYEHTTPQLEFESDGILSSTATYQSLPTNIGKTIFIQNTKSLDDTETAESKEAISTTTRLFDITSLIDETQKATTILGFSNEDTFEESKEKKDEDTGESNTAYQTYVNEIYQSSINKNVPAQIVTNSFANSGYTSDDTTLTFRDKSHNLQINQEKDPARKAFDDTSADISQVTKDSYDKIYNFENISKEQIIETLSTAPQSTLQEKLKYNRGNETNISYTQLNELFLTGSTENNKKEKTTEMVGLNSQSKTSHTLPITKVFDITTELITTTPKQETYTLFTDKNDKTTDKLQIKNIDAQIQDYEIQNTASQALSENVTYYTDQNVSSQTESLVNSHTVTTKTDQDITFQSTSYKTIEYVNTTLQNKESVTLPINQIEDFMATTNISKITEMPIKDHITVIKVNSINQTQTTEAETYKQNTKATNVSTRQITDDTYIQPVNSSLKLDNQRNNTDHIYNGTTQSKPFTKTVTYIDTFTVPSVPIYNSTKTLITKADMVTEENAEEETDEDEWYSAEEDNISINVTET